MTIPSSTAPIDAAAATSADLSPDVAVFILRAQPFHFGHQSVIRRALDQARHVVLLLGSALQPRTPMNPFTHNERAAMIRASFDEADNARIQIVPLMDVLFCESNPIPVKAALALRGLVQPEIRLPLTPISAPNRERLQVAMKEFGLL